MNAPTLRDLAKVECAKCGRAVERVSTWRSICPDRAMFVTFYCHGDTDIIVITDQEIFELGPHHQITITGRAFESLRKLPGDWRENDTLENVGNFVGNSPSDRPERSS